MKNLKIIILKLVLKIVSIFMIIFGGLISFGGISSIISGSNNFPLIPTIILLILFGICPAAIGVFLFIISFKKNKNNARDQILNIAQKYNGRITAMELALELSVSMDKAKLLLDNLASEGFIDSRIGKKGVLVYTFSGFLTDEDKKDAKRIEEL